MAEMELEASTEKPGGKKRKYNRQATQANIIAVATQEFAESGLAGARIDEIAEKTKTSKRMIYYYFGDKEGLYRQVLEAAYGRMRADEHSLNLEHLPPAEALRKLVEFTFTHHAANPDFIRLVMIENIHHGKFLEGSGIIQQLNAGAIEDLGRIYEAGRNEGVFRKGLKPTELHWMISALPFFNVSNQATFSKIFNWNQSDPEVQTALKNQAVEMILRFVLEPHLVET